MIIALGSVTARIEGGERLQFGFRLGLELGWVESWVQIVSGWSWVFELCRKFIKQTNYCWSMFIQLQFKFIQGWGRRGGGGEDPLFCNVESKALSLVSKKRFIICNSHVVTQATESIVLEWLLQVLIRIVTDKPGLWNRAQITLYMCLKQIMSPDKHFKSFISESKNANLSDIS